jgi:centromere protein C
MFFLLFLLSNNRRITTGPIQHLTDTQPAFSPAKSRRSSFRPVARTSDIDYDKIPSPRPNTSSRKSARNSIAGPSSASKQRKSQPEPNSGSPDPGDQDNGMGPDPFDDYAPRENRSPGEVSPRRKSFGGIEQEEDEEEEEEPPQETPSRRDKGKRKAAVYEEPDQDVEEEIAQELENVGLEMDSDDDQEVEEPQPPVKKTNTDVKNQKSQTQSKRKKENIGMLLSESYILKLISLTINLAPRQGVRRSQREHYRPLEYWRGEKLVYGRTPHFGPILVPQIKEIIRIPKEASVPLGTTKRKRGSTRARSHSKAAVEHVIPPALPVVDPEEGWDDNTEAKCTVIHFTSKEEVERRS